MSESEATENPRRIKGRSPSYPAINLRSAVQRAQQLYDLERQHPTSVHTIVNHWGYKSFNGPASLTLAALKKYGLVIDEGTGSSRRAAVSDLAVEILRNPNEAASRDALRRAALSPPVIRELWEKYGGSPPSDSSLHWELTRDRGFTDTGADEFIPTYRSTIEFAQLEDADRGEGGTDDSLPDEHAHGEAALGESSARDQEQRRASTTYTVPLTTGSAIVVQGRFPLSERDWQQFLAVLTAMKPGLVIDQNVDAGQES